MINNIDIMRLFPLIEQIRSPLIHAYAYVCNTYTPPSAAIKDSNGGDNNSTQLKTPSKRSACNSIGQLTSVQDAPLDTVRVLAGCHSLVQLEGKQDLVGDPLEQCTLKSVAWNLTKGNLIFVIPY